jgi:hypothetical protein
LDSVNTGKNPQLMSLLQRRSHVSGSGESAADHFVQSDLLSFGDEPEKSDNDPAVEKTVERLSVCGNDAPLKAQEKETRPLGGTVSR